jgi:hypothetical protein
MEYNEFNRSIPILWYVAHMGEKKNAWPFQKETLGQFPDLGVTGRIPLQLILKKWDVKM